jgi:hypothetical protein
MASQEQQPQPRGPQAATAQTHKAQGAITRESLTKPSQHRQCCMTLLLLDNAQLSTQCSE